MSIDGTWIILLLIAGILPAAFRFRPWVRVVCTVFLFCSLFWAMLGLYAAKGILFARLEAQDNKMEDVPLKPLTYFDGCYAMQDITMSRLPIIFFGSVGLAILAFSPIRLDASTSPNNALQRTGTGGQADSEFEP